MGANARAVLLQRNRRPPRHHGEQARSIWHTDAGGVYSAPINTFCSPNDATARTQTFCRGIQMTGADGWAHFRTIYPGWYSGRTTHIHATIRVNGSEMVTTQFYFPDALSEFVYRNHSGFSTCGSRSLSVPAASAPGSASN